MHDHPDHLHRTEDPRLLPRVVIACTVFFPLLARFGNATDDEGFLYVSAQRVLLGSVPHVDFESIYVAGRYLLLAAIFAVFGESLQAERAMLGLLRGGAVIGCFVAARMLMPTRLALVATVTAAMATGPLHNIYSLVPLVVVLPALSSMRTGRPMGLFVAGALGGLAVWFRQDTAVFAIIAVCMGTAFHTRRGGLGRVLRVAVPALLTASVVLAVVSEWVEPRVLFRQILTYAIDDGRPSLSRIPAFGGERGDQPLGWRWAQLLLAVVPLLAGVGGLVRAYRDEARRGLWITWSVLVVLCCNQVFRENSLVRFLQVSVLVWPLVVGVLQERLMAASARPLALAALPMLMLWTPISATLSGICSAEYTGSAAMPLLRRRPYVTRGSLFFGSTRRITQLREIEALVSERALYRETVVVYPRPMAVHQLLLQRHGGPAIYYGIRTRERTRALATALEGTDVHWLLMSMEHLDYPSDDAFKRMLAATRFVEATSEVQLWAPVCDRNWARGTRSRPAENWRPTP